ncbi:MAG: rRNA pseudouridine synthase, partial [Oscillospiraceae bacterium]|nr:rRNA pseudouridine synthase [Oscillospiraceae bacterium]
SEGLIILTNDGALADRLMHPRAEVDKVYEVWVTGFAEGREKLLERRIELDGYLIRQPKARLLSVKGDQARLYVTIHEGRNRQVRRMCEAAGLTVTRLRRVGEGSLRLGDLPKGKWRHLTPEEVRSLEK